MDILYRNSHQDCEKVVNHEASLDVYAYVIGV